MNLETFGLGVLLLMVLVLPFSVKYVEEELEAFLLVAGLAAVSLSGGWSRHLAMEALQEPLKIFLAVLLAGLGFQALRSRISVWLKRGRMILGLRALIGLLVFILGLISSLITAVVASLILAEALAVLALGRKTEIRIAVLACFAIGLGAVLTPLGEPLSTIATARLRGEPHHAGFWFLARHLGLWIVPMVAFLAAWSMVWAGGQGGKEKAPARKTELEGWRETFLRAGKVYLFVAALVLLGQGFSPLIEAQLPRVPGWVLYWLNMLSAALDNATLAAAELAPGMDLARIKSTLMGLLISGGMLIPGNIPNIICASKLGISSRDWAAIGVPMGLALMIAVFLMMYWGGIFG